jgi:hypothetical protein
MKNLFISASILLLSATISCFSTQNDFAISFDNYPNGSSTVKDSVLTSFTITNKGPVTYNIGDTIFVSVKINGIYYGIDLLDTKTAIVLTSTLGINGTIKGGAGYLSGSQTLVFYPSDTLLNFTLYAWGKGLASINYSSPTFPGDINPDNNTSTVTYNPKALADVSVRFLNYTPNQVTASDTLKSKFVLKNYGVLNLDKGDTVYMSSRLNGTYFGLDLIGSKTAIILSQNLKVNDTLIVDKGYLLGSQTLTFFPGATTLSFDVVAWGKGLSAVNLTTSSFPRDPNPSNNIASITFNPNLKGNLSITYVNYTNDQTSSKDTIQTKFIVKNIGQTIFKTGDTLYYSTKINGIYYGLDLLGNKTGLVLKKNLNLNDTLHINKGYLLGKQTLAFYPGATTLGVCVIVWGKGLKSVDLTPKFPEDIDSTNNTACINFVPAAVTNINVTNPISKLKVYPNPSIDRMNLEFEKEASRLISILDITGKEILKITSTETKVSVHVSDLSSGIYYIKVIENGDSLKQGKFVKL